MGFGDAIYMGSMVVKLQIMKDDCMIGVVELQETLEPLAGFIGSCLGLVDGDGGEIGGASSTAPVESWKRKRKREGGKHGGLRWPL